MAEIEAPPVALEATKLPEQDPTKPPEQDPMTQKALAGMEAAIPEIESAYAQKAKDRAAYAQQVTSVLQKPEFQVSAPRLEQPDDPPNVRAKDAEAFKGFFGPFMIFSMLLGKAMGADGVDALNMLSSGMRGFYEGRNQYSNYMLDQWKKKSEAIFARNRERLEMYKSVLEQKGLTLQEMKMQFELVAAQSDDAIMKAATKSGVYKDMLSAYDKSLKQQLAAEREYRMMEQAVSLKQFRLDQIDMQQQRLAASQDMLDRRLNAAAHVRAEKGFDQTEKIYNDSVEKLLRDATNDMFKLFTNPLVKPEDRGPIIMDLAKHLSAQLSYINRRIEAKGYRVHPWTRTHENAQNMYAMLMSGTDPLQDWEAHRYQKDVPTDRLGAPVPNIRMPEPQRPVGQPSPAFEAPPGGAAPTPQTPQGDVLEFDKQGNLKK